MSAAAAVSSCISVAAEEIINQQDVLIDESMVAPFACPSHWLGEMLWPLSSRC